MAAAAHAPDGLLDVDMGPPMTAVPRGREGPAAGAARACQSRGGDVTTVGRTKARVRRRVSARRVIASRAPGASGSPGVALNGTVPSAGARTAASRRAAWPAASELET